jgi:transposase InsO family protein
VLIELGVVEQRHKAVLEVLAGSSIVEVAERYSVSRQTVHRWLRRYAHHGIGGLADASSRPARCPHRTPPSVEARIVELRLGHPRWGPRTISHYLECEELEHYPSRSSIYRCLVRHRLIDPQRRRRRREDYRRWERLKAMELWQMDVMGGVMLTDGRELKLVSGLDDHSRYCVSATLIERATTRPVCEALVAALARHGVPAQILTDNGKVFTGRFGAHRREVLFDRLCRKHGIRHLLTAPHSPTTTGKVERFHKTLRAEFLGGRSFTSLEQAQEQLDAWVAHYNTERPHQGIGMVAPIRRFELAARTQSAILEQPEAFDAGAEDEHGPAPVEGEVVTRRVREGGRISLDGFDYYVGAYLDGETVELLTRANGLVEVHHRGVFVACHARRRTAVAKRLQRSSGQAQRTAGRFVLRTVDAKGAISFAGSAYTVGPRHSGRQVEVSIARGKVRITHNGTLLGTHAIRHDRSKELGAFAIPQGRPRQHTKAQGLEEITVAQELKPIRNTGTGT